MYFYSVFGYVFRSNIFLHSYPKAQHSRSYINIEKREGSRPRTIPDKKISVSSLPKNGLKITWHGVASYEVGNGSHVIVNQEKGSHPDLLVQPFYSIIPATLLLQKNYYIIHGNAVDINGRAVVLVGNKGLGKSTITAALIDKKHRLIADDVTAIHTELSPFEILPGIPNLKIWPDTVKVTNADTTKLRRINPFIEKYNYHLPLHFKNRNVPLSAIIFLDHGDKPNIEQLPPSQGILWLTGNSYLSRFAPALSQKIHKRTFRQSAQLAQQTTLLKLSYPRELNLLYDLVSLIEDHI